MHPRRFRVLSPDNLWQVDLVPAQGVYAFRDEAYICFAEATSGPTVHRSRWSITGVFGAVLGHQGVADLGGAVVEYYERLFLRYAPAIVAHEPADVFLHQRQLDDMLGREPLRPLEQVLREIEDLLLAIDTLPLVARKIARAGGAEHLINAPRPSKWNSFEPILRTDPRFAELAEFYRQYATVFARRRFMPLEGEDLAADAERTFTLGLVALSNRYKQVPEGMKLQRLENPR